ncbi:hypothetical protein FA13DRAFT_1707130 [Coprinellus micaceus]|uniref:Uncharacterized protein n=1 Tax=Coprinellus micaceus TaxID=71717 RepID=A0A4Y7TL60_COPMI|nr:hypothetical protein FA13DRAFT_1707130 [Coprinellus micaceus]
MAEAQLAVADWAGPHGGTHLPSLERMHLPCTLAGACVVVLNALAFKRAAMEREATIAHTHHLREAARLVPPTTKDRPRVRREAFQSAALSFLKCARGATVKEARVYFHNAGECFEQAGDCGDFFEDYRCAAKAYKEALEYNSAVKLYRKGDMFDEAVEVVQKHRREIDFDLAESVLEVARLFYFRRKDYKKAKSLFDSVQEQLEYFENNILLDECHADVLVELARYQEAADIHIEEGRTMKAIQVLLSDKSQESIRRANDHILQGLWQNTSFSMKIKDSDTAAVEFLSLASKVNYDFLSSTQKDEVATRANETKVAMFRNLRTTANDGIYFRDIAYEFLKRGEKPQALLCLDHFFNFLDYCRLFRETVTSLDLADEGSQKLFNFHPASVENAYHVPADTWLHRQINSATRKTGILEVDDAGIVVASADLFQALRTSLLRRLSERLSDQNSHCRRLQLWTPCLPHVVNGTCYRSGCPRQHLHKKELTQGWFNDQLRGVFLQIMVYQIYHSLPLEKEPERLFPDSRRYWIHKLHEAMRPPTHYMGSEACLRLEDIRAHAEPALAIVKSWCLDILHTRDIGRDRMVLSFLYEAAALCLMFDRSRAIQYLPQAPLLGTFTELACYYRPIAATGDKAYIVPELYQCLQAADVNFITAGTLFLHHVVSQRIAIDLNLLSHLYEFLAGSSVLARRKFGLHMVTLPRGWFVLLLQHTKVQEASTILLDRLLYSLAQLLRDLVYGGDGGRYLLFEGRDLAELPAIRDLFILRVCRALGLIGYNINHDDLRREVVDALKVLNSAKPHHSFKRFIGRHSWGGVALAVQSSYAESQLDDLVELYSMDGVGPLKPPPAGVRRVFFESSEHALVVLGKGPMRAEAPEFVPKAKVEAGAPSVANRGETDEPADQAFEQPETDSTELVDSRNLVESLVSTAAPLAPESITDEQKAIASTLLAGYRRIVRTRKMEKAKTQTQKSCDSFYLTCLKLSQGIDWGDVTFYKKLYLGLVPHLLTCVDVVQPYAQSAKKKLRPRLLDESERNLEGLNKEMNDLSAVLKSSANIRKQLDPSSSFHKERNVEKLKLLVGGVQELLDRVPSGHGLDVKLHLDIAIKGIVTEKKVPKPSPKPELNVDDLDDIYY